MARTARIAIGGLALLLLAMTGPGNATGASIALGQTGQTPTTQPTATKRLVAVMRGEPRTFSAQVERAVVGATPGIDELADLVSAGMTAPDRDGVLRPLLAEAVPTLGTVSWRLFPDGRMETTWVIRPGATWHDGTPITSADLIFTAEVARDQQLPFGGELGRWVENPVEAIVVTGPAVSVRWRFPVQGADAFFTRVAAQLLPRHLLADAYAMDPSSFLQHPYWNREFIGTGPFKVRMYEPGVRVILDANTRYVLGRPRIDEIEVRFISNVNALVANMLASNVDLSLGPSVALDLVQPLRDRALFRTEDGPLVRWVAVYPQFIHPTPPIVASLPFRQALYHAIDRDELIRIATDGVAIEANAIIPPNDPTFAAIEGQITRFGYDPSRALQTLEDLGYARGAVSLLHDAAGERLDIEIRALDNSVQASLASRVVAAYWDAVGVAAESVLVSPQDDAQYRAAFPGFFLRTQPTGDRASLRYHSSATPMPENRFAGTNISRYQDDGLDRLIDRYRVVLSRAEQTQRVAEIVGHMSEQLPVLGLFYDMDPVLIANRVVNVVPPTVGSATVAWNSHEWDIRPSAGRT